MDRKFDCDNSWFVSPVIELRQYRDEALAALKGINDLLGLNRPIEEDCDGRDATLAKILSEITSCSQATSKQIYNRDLNLQNLVGENGVIHPQFDLDIVDTETLRPDLFRTHEYLKQNLERFKNPQRKSNFYRSLKYDKCDATELGLPGPAPSYLDSCDDDIVISVSVTTPRNKCVTEEEQRNGRLLQPQMKFMLRGETLLSDLRKKLICPSDMAVDLEDGREFDPPDPSKFHMVLFPSSFIFIHDTFYSDYSKPGCSDISVPIREFMGRKKCFDPVYQKDIAGVKMVDLKLRLGQPYVYMHSGNCEHLLIFHDLRLLHRTDKKPLSKYPLTIYEKSDQTRCSGCLRSFATYVVEREDFLPAPYVFFCDVCFAEFNYLHGTKTKLGTFKAHPVYKTNCLRLPTD